MDYFALNFRTLKEAFGYTYDDVQELVSISRATVRNYLAAVSMPGRKKIEEIAKAFGTTYQEITSREITWSEAETLAARATTKQQKTSTETVAAEDEDGGYKYDFRPRPESTNSKEDEEEPYDVQLAVYVGSVIDKILTKHQVAREAYARNELKRSERTLQRIIKGEIMATLPLLMKITQDFGESLDLFRLGPLPKGHYLRLLEEQAKVIAGKEETIISQRELLNQYKRTQ